MKRKKGFAPGQSGNPAGRPAGSKNRSTKEIREKITKLISDNFETLEKDFKKLNPEKRLSILERYLRYIVPPLQNVNVQAEIMQKLEKLSDEELDTLADKIIQITQNQNQ